MEGNWIKIALEVNKATQLTQLNVDLDVEEIVRGVCEANGVAYERGAYALKVRDLARTAGTEYVTEDTKRLLRHGRQLKLSSSPAERIAGLLDRLHKSKDADSSLKSLRALSAASRDSVLLREMHRQNVLQNLRVYASVRSLSEDEDFRFYKVVGQFLARDYLSQLNEDEVGHLVDIITCDRKVTKDMLLLSFEVLILLRKKGALNWPMKHLKKLTLYVRLYEETKLQERSIQLMNCLYLYAGDPEERRTVGEFMKSSMMVTYINKYVIRKDLTDAIKHQLYLYQKIILRKYNKQLRLVQLEQCKILENLEYVVSNIALVSHARDARAFGDADVPRPRKGSGEIEKAHAIFTGLRMSLAPVGRQRAASTPNARTAEEGEFGERLRSRCSDADNRFLLEKIEQRRIQLSREVSVESVDSDVIPLEGDASLLSPAAPAPDGVSELARDNLYYFILNDFKGFERFLFSHKNQLNSVLTVSVGVSSLLCRIFEIRDREPEVKRGRFVPLCFLYYDLFFERMFCIALRLFLQTRQEMSVAVDSGEYPAVLRTVEEQLLLALEAEPFDFLELEKRLNELSAAVVMQKREDAIRKEVERQLTQEPAFVELRELVTPRIMERIQEKRLRFMETGEHVPQFDYKGQRVVGKWWFVFLSRVRDRLHVEECCDDPCRGRHKPLVTVPVGDVQEVESGAKSNFHKEVFFNLCTERDMFFRSGVRQQEPDIRFPISLRLNNLSYVDFCAGSELTMDYWVDGIGHLTGEKMKSETTKEELSHLLDIELMTRLAELEGVRFPNRPPPVPPPPPDFDFSSA